ncbi:hypothetical protein KKA01_00795, partial [Patescibacteria group bacterium]|nr:hypothetical protein [Patescibacteria group bacterium]
MGIKMSPFELTNRALVTPFAPAGVARVAIGAIITVYRFAARGTSLTPLAFFADVIFALAAV